MEKTIMSFTDFELNVMLRLCVINKTYVVLSINNDKNKSNANGFKYYKDAIEFYKEQVNDIMKI